MEYFDSNEQMYIKVANEENYDVLIPSDYMIQRLMDEGYLQKLKPELLTCMDEITDSVKHPGLRSGRRVFRILLLGNRRYRIR